MTNSSSEDVSFSSDESSDVDSRAEAAGNRPMRMAFKEKLHKKTKKMLQEEVSQESEISTITISDSDSEVFEDVEKVLETRDLLVEFGASEETEDSMETALSKLELFLGTTKLEYEKLDALTGDLLKEVDKLTAGLADLGDIFGPEPVEDELVPK